MGVRIADRRTGSSNPSPAHSRNPVPPKGPLLFLFHLCPVLCSVGPLILPFVGKHAKLIEKITGGTANASISFRELRAMLEHSGFTTRVKGSHHIFSRVDVHAILNIQPLPDGKAKPYQVRQVAEILLAHDIK